MSIYFINCATCGCRIRSGRSVDDCPACKEQKARRGFFCREIFYWILAAVVFAIILSGCTVTPPPVYDTQAPLQNVIAQVYPDKSADLTPFGVSVYNATVAYYGRDTYFKPPEAPLPSGVVHLTPQQLEDFGVMQEWHNNGYVPVNQ